MIGSLIGGGIGAVKKFLSKRAVSFLGVNKRSPLYQPLVDFVSSMPSSDIMSLYRDDLKSRDKLINVLTDESINILKKDMSNFFGVDPASSLGGSITSAITKVIDSPGFKQSVKQSFNNSFRKFVNSEVADMSDIRQAIAGLRGEIGGLAGDVEKLKRKAGAAGVSVATGKELGKIKDKVKDPAVMPPKEEATEAAEEATEAAQEAEKAEEEGDVEAAAEAAGEAVEAAEDAQEAAEDASGEPDQEEVEAAAEKARVAAEKAIKSKLRIPMRDFIKDKLNLDNDLGKYDPRISLEDLQAIHDNFLAAETAQRTSCGTAGSCARRGC